MFSKRKNIISNYKKRNLANEEKISFWNKIRPKNSSLQIKEASTLTTKASIEIPPDGCTVTEIIQFQGHLAIIK